DPWQVFFDVRFLGNSRVDPCSRILKRQFLRKWLEQNCDPTNTIVYLGIDWTEEHRYERAKSYWSPWNCLAPLCDPPYLTKEEIMQWAEAEGLRLPRLYHMGFPHNNCGGFCIKAGQAHFKLLLEKMPERYAYHEQREQELRKYLGKDVAILRDRRGGKSRPLTLREFRYRLQSTGEYETDEWGGCGCFSPLEYEPKKRRRKVVRYKPAIKPWPHQADALKRLWKMGSAILWFKVRTGKTKIAVD